MGTTITEQDKKQLLDSKRWFTWYNPDYWCHEQFGNAERDCTSWGMSLDEAYNFETNLICKINRLAAIEAFTRILAELNK